MDPLGEIKFIGAVCAVQTCKRCGESDHENLHKSNRVLSGRTGQTPNSTSRRITRRSPRNNMPASHLTRGFKPKHCPGVKLCSHTCLQPAPSWRQWNSLKPMLAVENVKRILSAGRHTLCLGLQELLLHLSAPSSTTCSRLRYRWPLDQ